MTHALASRSRYIPWLFVAGFAVVIAVNATMIWFAVGSFSGLYTPVPRDRGLHYNAIIAEQKAARCPGLAGRRVVARPKAAASRSRCSMPRASRWPARA